MFLKVSEYSLFLILLLNEEKALSSTKDDDLFCFQDPELSINENHTSVNYQNTIHWKHKENRNSETNTLKPKKRRYLKQHSSKSESNDKNDFQRVKLTLKILPAS